MRAIGELARGSSSWAAISKRKEESKQIVKTKTNKNKKKKMLESQLKRPINLARLARNALLIVAISVAIGGEPPPLELLRGIGYRHDKAAATISAQAEALELAPRITVQPNDLIAIEGESTELNCDAEGEPEPQIEWFHNGQPIRSSTQTRTTMGGSIQFLDIRPSGPSTLSLGLPAGGGDAGIYYCLAKNALGQARSRNASLQVAYIRPEFRIAPKDKLAPIGESATFDCLPQAWPEPRIQWRKNELPLDIEEVKLADGSPKYATNRLAKTDPDQNKDDQQQQFVDLFGSQLVIRQVDKQDEGFYSCLVETKGSHRLIERESPSAQLLAQVKPYFVEAPQDTPIELGGQVRLRCRMGGDPEPVISWRKQNGQPLSEKIQIDPTDKSLSLDQVSQADQGTYVCEGENSVGSARTMATITVTSRPKFIVQPEDQEVVAGSQVQLRCSGEASPQPMLFWYKEGHRQLMFPQQLSQQTSPSSSQLQADSTAEWLPPNLPQTASLVASDFKSGHIPSSDTSPAINKLFTLPLGMDKFLSSPSTFQTLGNNNFFANRIYVDSHGALNIHNVTPSDGGYYACALTSSVGSALAKAKLTVTQASNSIGLMQADAYDPMNLQAFRSYGPNFNSKYEASPPPVIKFGSANQTLPLSTSATLICDVVSIVAYKILWKFENQPVHDNPPRVTLLDTGALQIENLTSTDSGVYTCEAATANEQMAVANPYEPLETSMLTSAPPIQQSSSHSTMLKVASPRNPNFQFFRMVAYEYPSAPGQPRKVALNGDNGITISWDPPAEPGKNPVKEYIVEHYSTSEEHLGWERIKTIKGKEMLMIDGLSEDGSHFFVIRAVNGHGVGPSSGIAGPFRTSLGELGYMREMASRGLTPTPTNLLTTSNMRPESNLARERLPIITTSLLSAVPVSSKSIRLQWSTQVNGNVTIESSSNYPMMNSPDIYNFIEGYSIRYRPIASAESQLQARDSYPETNSWNPWPTGNLVGPSALPLVTSFLNDEEELAQTRNKRDLINYYDNSQDFSEVRVVDHLTEHYTVNGLRPFIVYQFFVVPYYKDIDGVQSNLLTAQTHEDVPSLAPPNLTILPLNDTSVRLLWSHISPLFANGILRGYSLKVNRSDIMNGQQIEYQGYRADKIMKIPIASLKIGPASLFTGSDIRNQPFNVGSNSYWVMFELTNLTHKSMYSISISAYTNVGLGPWTDNQNFIMDHAALSQIQNDLGEYGNLFSGKDFISFPPQHLDNNSRRAFQANYIYGILVLIVISSLFIIGYALYRRNNQRVITWRKTISEHFTNKFYMPSTVDPRGPNSIQQNIYDHQQHLLYSGTAHMTQPNMGPQPVWTNNNGCVNSSGTGSISSHGGLLPIASADTANRSMGGEQVLFLNGKDMNTRFIKNQIAGKNIDNRTLNLNPNPVQYGHQGDYYSVINNIAEYEEFDPQARNNMLLMNNSEVHQTASSNSDTSCPSSVTRLLPNQTHTAHRGPFNKFNDNQRHEMTLHQQAGMTQDGRPAFATMINNEMGRIQPMVQLSPYATTNLMNHGHALVPQGQIQQQQLFANNQQPNMNFTLHNGAVMSMDDSAKILRSQPQQHVGHGKQVGQNLFRTLQRNPMNGYHSGADHNQQHHPQHQHHLVASNQPTQVIHQGFYHPHGQYQTSSIATNTSNVDDRSNLYEHVEYSDHMHAQSQASTNVDQAQRYHSSQSSNDIVSPSTSSGSLKVLPQKQLTVNGKPPVRQSTIEAQPGESKEVHDLRVFASTHSKEMNGTVSNCNQLNEIRSSSEENDKNGELDDASEADGMLAPRQRSSQQQQEHQLSPSQSDNQNKVRGKSGQLSKRKRHQQRNRLHNSLQGQ